MRKVANVLWRLGICLICTLMLTSNPAFSAKAGLPAGTGTLAGKVTIAGTRTAVVGADVSASGAAGIFSAVTDSRGNYSMNIPGGGYEVTASAAGFNSQTYSATVMIGTKTVLNFTLSETVETNGALQGRVTDGTTGAPIAGAAVSADHGGYSALTDAQGGYRIESLPAGSYVITAAAGGYNPTSQTVSIEAGLTSTADFALAAQAAGLSISGLTATPDAFQEGAASTVTLEAVIEGTPTAFEWVQISGPKVPLLTLSAESASADVSLLSVAAESELVFRLALTAADGTSVSREAKVFVQPVDMLPFLGEDVQIGGSATAIGRFSFNGAEWCLFNIGTGLKATPVGMAKGPVYTLTLPGAPYNVKVVPYGGQIYALAAIGGPGIAVVNITDPTVMTLVNVVPVNYYLDNVTFTETGGSILPGNIFESAASPIVDLETDGTSLFIANHDFGIQKTSLANLFGNVRELDGTLLIDQEVATVQYAGEKAWGGPISLKLFGGRLFSAMGMLGMGIFDPATLDQVGRYNLYSDEARTEDYFGAMAVTQAVSSDPVTGDLFLDDFTGMPDYRQVNYEITVIMKGTGTGEPTPWADIEREGKWYYETLDVDIARQGSRTIAYLACSLGGVVAVDVTGFETATAAALQTGTYLGFFPATPANGPYETLSLPSSLLPYEGAGMLKESGVTAVRVQGDTLYLTDHFAGLVILSGASAPELAWKGLNPPYNNDTNGIPNDNVPVFEDITSYDMSPWDPLDNESLPWAYYQAPCQLATRELSGHGYTLALMDAIDLSSAGQVDVLECSGGGGFVFVDVFNLSAPVMTDRFSVPVYFPSTDEIGAAADGTATQTIAIGHADGIAASENYIYLSDGPHGISAWKITDDLGFPTDSVHLVANTLQDEYPEEVNGELIYPASHTVRNVIDPSGRFTWALCVGNGLRRVPIEQVEIGAGVVGAPLLMKLYIDDSYEHNADWGVVKAFPYQDQAYDVEFVGNLAFVADGTNGLTVYDTSKDPTKATSGFFVGNIGYAQAEPLLGTASGVELWNDPATGRRYAVLASGPYGVSVVDATDVNALKVVKVFEPIKYENGDLSVADGQAMDVEVIGDKAYFTYDSFGVLCYSMADLVAPVPDGVDPTELFKRALDGTVIYDYRPVALAQFKLQYVPGYEEVEGGAVKMAYTEAGGRLNLYVAFGAAGVVKVDYTDSTAPVLVDRVDTAGECVDVEIAHGRLFVADHGGGMVFFK